MARSLLLLAFSAGALAPAQPGHAAPADATPAALGTPRTLAIVLVNFPNDTSQPLTLDQARAQIFTDAGSANSFWKDASGGLISFAGRSNPDGDVFGWYTIDTARACDNTAATSNLVRTEGTAKATAAGVDLAAYDHVMWVYPAPAPCTSYGDIGGKNAHMPVELLRYAAYQLGHNLGLRRADALACTGANGERVTFSETCTNVAWGDPSDMMGDSLTAHFNAGHKQRLGLIPPMRTATASGVFKLSPTEDGSGAIGLRIKRDTVGGLDRFYELEIRRPKATFSTGCDFGRGVSIRLTVPVAVEQAPQLLDATPQTPTFHDAGLPVGQTFRDEAAGIAIRTLKIDATGAEVAIALGDDPLPDAELAGDPRGWSELAVEYFAGRDRGGEGVPGEAPKRVDFDWGAGGPAPGIPADEFSARVTGKLTIEDAGQYTLLVRSDDGVRVTLDGAPVIDDYLPLARQRGAVVQLGGKEPHDVTIDYFEAYGDAALQFGLAGGSALCAIPVVDREVEGVEELPDEAPTSGGVSGCAAGGSGTLAGLAALLLAWPRRRRA